MKQHQQIDRRAALAGLGAGSYLSIAGCDRAELADRLEQVPTETLENSRLALRGFQLVSFQVGHRLVFLPHPAVRVLGVALVVSGVAVVLVVDYLDTELKRRSLQEPLEQRERLEIEAAGTVEFTTDNGLTESVVLAPNRYQEPRSDDPNSTTADEGTSGS